MRMDKLTHSLQAALGDAQSPAVGRITPSADSRIKSLLDHGFSDQALLRAAGTAWNRCRPR